MFLKMGGELAKDRVALAVDSSIIQQKNCAVRRKLMQALGTCMIQIPQELEHGSLEMKRTGGVAS